MQPSANPRPRPSPVFSRARQRKKSPYELPHIIAARGLSEKVCRDSAPWREQPLSNASTQSRYTRQTFLHRLAQTGAQFEPPTTFCCQYAPCRPIRATGIRSEMKRIYGINGPSRNQPLPIRNKFRNVAVSEQRDAMERDCLTSDVAAALRLPALTVSVPSKHRGRFIDRNLLC
jgi:hypothetical protein